MARILVCEDDADVTELLLILLEAAGHETWHVDNGTSAIDAFATARPDLVLLDVAMPGPVDGLEVTRRVRALEAASGEPRVPIMLLTARALEEDRRAGLDAGADVYVVKPFEIDEMLRAVESLLP